MNDRWATAVHEAGHAVIGRVLKMTCGYVTIVADDDSAGHAITADPWAIMYDWDRRGHGRTARTVFRGRVLNLMAGAEAEIALLGHCKGGDGDDRYQVDMMLESEAGAADGDNERLERRLRQATRMLVRRHIGKIDGLARALWRLGTIEDDDEIRHAAGLGPPPADVDYWGLLSSDAEA